MGVTQIDLVPHAPLRVLVGIGRGAQLDLVVPFSVEQDVMHAQVQPQLKHRHGQGIEHAEQVERPVRALALVQAEVEGRAGRAWRLR
jgi:hypothetical protein